MRQRLQTFIVALTMGIGIEATWGAVVYSTAGTTVQQNFDTLAASGTPSWTNDSTLPGWSLFRQPAPGTAITSYTPGNGSSNAGAFNSFGTSGSNERSLGGTGSGGAYFDGPASGNVAGWIAVAIQNNTGNLLNSFTVQYDGEQWRDGGNTSAQTMALQYGFGATFGTVGTWNTPGGNFNFTSLINTGASSALDGNAAANRTAGRGGTIPGLTWNNGDTLWIRWIENNDVGNDHGLAIDNWSFSATGVPEPTVLGMGLMGLIPWLKRRSR